MIITPTPDEPENNEGKPYPNSRLIPISGRDVVLSFTVAHLQIIDCQAIHDPDELRKGMIPILHDPTA